MRLSCGKCGRVFRSGVSGGDLLAHALLPCSPPPPPDPRRWWVRLMDWLR